MEYKSDILAIVDNDFLYGIEHGYYPKLTQDIYNGKIDIISIDKYNELKKDFLVSVSKEPECSGMDFYIKNPYCNNYISVLDDDLVCNFINDRSIVMKEAFVRLGAKSIRIEDGITDKDTSSYHVDGKAGNKIVQGHLEASYKKAISVNLNSKIESFDPNRVPMSFQEVRQYLFSHGLEKEHSIMVYLERLKEFGRLRGTETYEITFCSEIKNAFHTLAKIDYKLFNSQLDFSFEHEHIHTITKKLFIDFG